MDRTIVATDSAPRAIGPYSQAVLAGGFLFCSGQIPLDPKTGAMAGTTASDQARVCLENLRAVLEAGGSSLGRVLRVTLYLTSMDDFPEVNKVYEGFFPQAPPARATVAVKALPKGALVEVDAIALAG